MSSSSDESHQPHVGVIGGGIAGLTVAYRLASAGYRVSLWEQSAELGGLAAAFDVPGGQLEKFYHHLFMSDRAIVGLINELGMADDLLWLNSQNSYYSRGQVYSLSSPMDLLKLPIVPFQDRIRIGLVTLYLQQISDEGDRWRQFEDVTAWEWLRRWTGERAFQRTFGAQLQAKFGPRAQQVAMVWFWNKIFLRTKSRPGLLGKEQLGYINGSFNTLIDRLADAADQRGADINTQRGVSRVEPSAQGQYLVDVTDDEQARVDALVVTTPAPIFLKFFPDTPEPYRSKLTAIPYQGAVCVLLRLDRQLTNAYWLNIADPDVPFTVLVEHTNFIPPEAYDGNHYVYINTYVDWDHPFVSMSEDELIDTYLSQLPRFNSEFDRSWVKDIWTFRARAAQPVIQVGHAEQIPSHRTPFDSVYLATMSQIYPEDRGTNYAVNLGNRVAQMVDQDLSSRC